MKKVFIGVDISKEKLDVSVIMSPESISMEQYMYLGEYPNTTKECGRMVRDVAKIAKGTEKSDWLFCAESTGGYSRCLCDTIYKKGLCIWKESALQIKWSKGIVRGKNDKADSRMIAEYAMRNQDKMRPYVPDSPSVVRLKQLFRYRESLVKEVRARKARLVELESTAAASPDLSFILRDTKKAIESLAKSIEECEKRMEKAIGEDDDLRRNFKHITSIKGVGMVNAVELIICTNNFLSISDARKLSCYCGVAPFYQQSGTSVHGRARVGNLSDKLIKAHLTNAALVAVRHDPEMRIYYDRLVNNGKHQGIALNNVKNKILRIVCSLVKNDCDYEEFHEEKRKKMPDTERIGCFSELEESEKRTIREVVPTEGRISCQQFANPS